MINALRTFDAGNGKTGFYHSLPVLEENGLGKISRLPVSIRIVLESVLRNCDGKKVAEKDVKTLAAWNAKTPAQEEIPFVVARIVLQDFTGVPLLVDLAAMRTAVAKLRKDPKIVEPLVPVDLVVDHSVQVDFFGSPDALRLNLEIEFQRNRERYQFLKWGQQAFKTLAAGNRHRSPGQSRIPRQGSPERGNLQGHRLLSGHPCRDRLAHDHDQWPRRRRMGRRGH
jgi:aconitate hydratase